MSKFTDGVDKLRDIALDERLKKIGTPRSSLPDAEFADILECAVRRLRGMRLLYRPDKIISRALMVPSYQRLIVQLRNPTK